MFMNNLVYAIPKIYFDSFLPIQTLLFSFNFFLTFGADRKMKEKSDRSRIALKFAIILNEFYLYL